jgi:folate-dependent phosphoribosylglycinamide formyltransferase PurN
MRLVLTAGWNGAPHVLALAELLQRRGHTVAGLLVVTPWNPRRLRRLLRSRGRAAFGAALRKLRGRPGRSDRGDALQSLLEREHIEPQPLSRWALAQHVPYSSVRDLNAPAALAWLRRCAPDGVLYGGGGILHAPFLEACAGRVLNAHSGPLPAIRGMNACEWALLLRHRPEISVHYIERGIDTGPLVLRRRIELVAGEGIDALRARCAAEGVHALLDALPALEREKPEPVRGTPTRQVYVLAPALRQLAERRLARAALAESDAASRF